MRPFVVGLTGGVASGKSQVEALLRHHGVPVLDADQVAREVVAPGEPGLAQVVAAFGPEVLDAEGRLDRRRLRERVFADAAERRRLEAILHPLIGARIEDWIRAQSAPYVVVSIAILLESRFREQVDAVWVVDAPEALQRERLMARDGIDAELAERMIAAQLPRSTRLAQADLVIANDGDRSQLADAVARAHSARLGACHERTGR